MKTLEEINISPARIDDILEHFKMLRFMLVNVGQSEGYFTMAENPYIAQLRDVTEKLSSKATSESMTQFLHDLSLTVNNFS
jgi:hypothetical protein